MKLIIQRVNKASVSVDDKVVGEINKGLFILLGIAEGDSEDEVYAMAQKISKLRIMADENDKMNLSVLDTKSSILVVSQFTLIADTKKGNRPSFVKAANPKKAEKLYSLFISELKALGIKVETGEFGKYMKIDTELDGPVTIVL